jgi:predicted transcriptional regulator
MALLFFLMILFAPMSTFNLNHNSQINNPVYNQPATLQQNSETLLNQSLYALGLNKKEVEIYNYFFLYGPASLTEATQGVNFPTNISKTDLEQTIPKLVSKGFLLNKTGEYTTSGLEYLINQTGKNKDLSDLHQKLIEWKNKSIQ